MGQFNRTFDHHKPQRRSETSWRQPPATRAAKPGKTRKSHHGHSGQSNGLPPVFYVVFLAIVMLGLLAVAH